MESIYAGRTMHSRTRAVIAQAAVSFVLLTTPSRIAEAAPRPDPSLRISQLVETIRTATDSRVEEDAAYELPQAAWRLAMRPLTKVPSATISELASLLDSKNEIVVVQAANTLGMFGTRALPAVPALRRALVEYRRSWDEYISARIPPVIILVTGVDAGGTICRALDDIGAPTDYGNCFEGLLLHEPSRQAPPPDMLRWSKFIRR